MLGACDAITASPAFNHGACSASDKRPSAPYEEASMVSYAAELSHAIETLIVSTKSVLSATQEQGIDVVFSNSVNYLDLFGYFTIA